MVKKILTEIGWREDVALPALCPRKIKVKVDTGARTSALHVSNIEFFKRKRTEYVRFKVHPDQNSSKPAYEREARLVDSRKIKSSTGHETIRPVIETELVLGEHRFTTEVTLVNRDLMGFRMLLGRQALRGRFVVNVSKSYMTRKKGVKK